MSEAVQLAERPRERLARHGAGRAVEPRAGGGRCWAPARAAHRRSSVAERPARRRAARPRRRARCPSSRRSAALGPGQGRARAGGARAGRAAGLRRPGATAPSLQYARRCGALPAAALRRAPRRDLRPARPRRAPPPEARGRRLGRLPHLEPRAPARGVPGGRGLARRRDRAVPQPSLGRPRAVGRGPRAHAPARRRRARSWGSRCSTTWCSAPAATSASRSGACCEPPRLLRLRVGRLGRHAARRAGGPRPAARRCCARARQAAARRLPARGAARSHRSGLHATKVDVRASDARARPRRARATATSTRGLARHPRHPRRWSTAARRRGEGPRGGLFRRLAEAEAAVHGTSPEDGPLPRGGRASTRSSTSWAA